MVQHSAAEVSAVSAALARNKLGVPKVSGIVLSSVAPLTVAAGVVTTAFAVTGLSGVPVAFAAVALVLAVFAVGYTAMARHITNAGAFYGFLTRGLGRPIGVGGALVALVSYTLLQVGLYGGIGPAAAGYFADNFGINAPWVVFALGAWALVAVLGQVGVSFGAWVLGVLLSLEVVVLSALTLRGLAHPADGRVSLAALNPAHLTTGVGPALAIAVLGFAGFEQVATLSEEARRPHVTIPVATGLALGVIGVLFAASSWALPVHYGGRVVALAQQQGPQMLFNLGPGLLSGAARTLFLTSLFAAALAFHGPCWRYMFALGREHVLPSVLARTGTTGVPRIASAVQSTIGLGVILLYAAAGWDPLTKLFFWLGTAGGTGLLILLAATSAAVVRFFAQGTRGETAWRRLIAPLISGVLLMAMVWLCLRNYSTLLGVAPGSRAAWMLPGVYPAAFALGLAWALVLKTRRPEVYQQIGQRSYATLTEPTPARPLALEG